MDKITNILITGVGGQGIIVASDVLAEAAMVEGFDVKKSEVHGMSQRGGPVFSHVRFGKKVFSPVTPEGGCDIIVSFELMETFRWREFITPQTTAIVLDNKISPAGLARYPEKEMKDNIKKFFKRSLLVENLKNAGNFDRRCSNIFVMGILSEHIGIKPASWRKAINNRFKGDIASANLAAFSAGKEYRARG